MKHIKLSLLALITLLASWPSLAYIGPGAGLSAIGTVIALAIFIILIFIGFFWYPIKRMRNQKKESQENDEILEDDFK